jgi:hypothetical protein
MGYTCYCKISRFRTSDFAIVTLCRTFYFIVAKVFKALCLELARVCSRLLLQTLAALTLTP